MNHLVRKGQQGGPDARPGASAALAASGSLPARVDTPTELATRNPENLAAKLAEVGGASAPDVTAVRAWIAAATAMAPGATHWPPGDHGERTRRANGGFFVWGFGLERLETG